MGSAVDDAAHLLAASRGRLRAMIARAKIPKLNKIDTSLRYWRIRASTVILADSLWILILSCAALASYRKTPIGRRASTAGMWSGVVWPYFVVGQKKGDAGLANSHPPVFHIRGPRNRRLAADSILWLLATMVRRGARRLPQDVPITTRSFGKQLQVSIIVPLSGLGDRGRGLMNLRGRGKYHRSTHQDHCQSKDFKEKQSARAPARGSTPLGALVATRNPGFVGKTNWNGHGSLLSGHIPPTMNRIATCQDVVA